MISTIIEYVKDLATNPSVVLFGAVTLIEVTPIKLNPWKWLFSWIGNAFNGDIKKDLSELKRDFEETKAQDKRWRILNFADTCRRGEHHSKEEWEHVISEVKEYEQYVKNHNLDNGVIEENSKYLRELYHERIIENDFL